MEEVENENVIKLLSKELGYSDWIVSKSPDKRRIDLAILYDESSSLKKKAVHRHELRVVISKKRPSRNILEAAF